MILLHGWSGETLQKTMKHKRKFYCDNKLSDPKNKTANIWSPINSAPGQGKKSFVDGVQPVEFQSFLLKKVESARNLIRTRK